jgi:ABC-type dipeptide/oligopeptide/nickel transport system permease subunit
MVVAMAEISVRPALPSIGQRIDRPPRSRSLWSDAMRRLLANRLAAAGFVVVFLFLLMALIGPYIAPHDFLAQDVKRALEGPSSDYWFGTDALGRDIFSRLLFGARTAAIVAITTTAISLLLGVALGLAAGFLGGRTDALLMWFTDVTMSLPNILLALLINATLKYHVASWFDSLYQKTRNPFFLQTRWVDFVLIFGALALISWPGYARMVRAQVLSGKTALYVEAARVTGANTRHIMLRHLMPNSLGPVIVAVTQGMGGAILLESSLSFLGIGVQPPNASWGTMLADSLTLWRSSPHLMLAPAVTIGLIQIAFVFFGDGLNDALNPRQRR